MSRRNVKNRTSVSGMYLGFLAALCFFLTGHYVQRKRRYRRGGSGTPLSILKRELREGNLQSLLGGSSSLIPSSTSQPDSLLSSFIFNPPAVDEPLTVQPVSSNEARTHRNGTAEDLSKRSTQPSPLSEKDQEERARKCEFVQGLLLSTFLDDNL